MTIPELKQQIDIVEVIGNYTELTGYGNRLRAKTNPLREGGDFDVYQDTQKFYDQGTGEGGDVFDFIKIVENLSGSEALSFLSERYIGGSNITTTRSKPIPRPYTKPIKKDNNLLLSQLKNKAFRYLNDLRIHNSRPMERYRHFTLEMDESKEVASLDEPFIKLFEHSYLEVEGSRIDYIFQKFVGYDNYYDCPTIILYDLHGNVVNIIKYRPKKDGGVFMKYLYSKSEDVPESSYLYPFQFEMERMILKHGFCYVGEGLKNALNALVFGLPYISIESASGVNDMLLEYLKSPRMKDVFYIGTFDGDAAGERAYKKMSAVIPMENEFEFDSGLDFADKMKKDNQ
jgi:DNA primase